MQEKSQKDSKSADARREAGIDQRLADQREDGDDAYQTIIIRCKQSCQHDADQERHCMRRHTVNRAPPYTLYGLILQRF